MTTQETKKLRIQDFKDIFGYNYGKIEIHTVELEAGENTHVSVVNYGCSFDGRQLTKIPHNTPIMVQVFLKHDGYYELEDDCLMIIDQGELKEYKREYDHQTTFEAASVEEMNQDQVINHLKQDGFQTVLNYKGYDLRTCPSNFISIWEHKGSLVKIWKDGEAFNETQCFETAFYWLDYITR